MRVFRRVVQIVLSAGGVIGALWWIVMAARLLHAWWRRWELIIAELAALRNEILVNCDLPDVRMTAGMREHCATWGARRNYLLEETPAWRAWGMALHDANVCGSDGCIKEFGDQAIAFMTWSFWASVVLLMIFLMIIYLGRRLHEYDTRSELDAYCLPGAPGSVHAHEGRSTAALGSARQSRTMIRYLKSE